MSKEQCLCGISVTKAASFIGFFQLLVNIVFIAEIYINNERVQVPGLLLNHTIPELNSNETNIDLILAQVSEKYGFFSLCFNIVSILIVFTMLYGNQADRPKFFAPYLFFMVLFIAFFNVAVIFLTSIIILNPHYLGSPRLQWLEIDKFGLNFAIIIITIILIDLMCFYFCLIVVNRARNFILKGSTQSEIEMVRTEEGKEAVKPETLEVPVV